MLKGIIFDMDGTLLNTFEDIAYCCNESLQKFGYPLQDIKKYKSIGSFKDFVNEITNNSLDESKTNEIIKYYREIYNENCMNKTAPYDGIIPMLEKLQSQGLKLGILSNKPHKFTEKLTLAYFPKGLFDVVAGQKENVPLKPDPTSLIEMLTQMPLSKNEVIFVGDSDYDILTAKNGGIKSIGATWSCQDQKELIDNGADYIANHPNDILDIVL